MMGVYQVTRGREKKNRLSRPPSPLLQHTAAGVSPSHGNEPCSLTTVHQLQDSRFQRPFGEGGKSPLNAFTPFRVPRSTAPARGFPRTLPVSASTKPLSPHHRLFSSFTETQREPSERGSSWNPALRFSFTSCANRAGTWRQAALSRGFQSLPWANGLGFQGPSARKLRSTGIGTPT